MKWLVLITLLAAGCFRDHPTATDLAQTDCISCHQTDFAQSTQHQGQGSTACAACHDPNIMPPWAFAHPQAPFPTESGRHAQFAQQCHTCHNATLGNDYRANLDCYGGGACHGDSHHHDPTQPGRCFQCHPTGNAGGGD
jgi:hypothetical protein